MFCEKCGAPLVSGAVFCTRCGAPGGRADRPLATAGDRDTPLGEIARAWRFGRLTGPARVVFRSQSFLYVWQAPPRGAGRAQRVARTWMHEWLGEARPGPTFLRPPDIAPPDLGKVEQEIPYESLLRVHVSEGGQEGSDPRVVATNVDYRDPRDPPQTYRLSVFAILGDRVEARRFLSEMPVGPFLDRPLPTGFKPARWVL